MSTADNVALLIDHVRDLILASAPLAEFQFTKQTLYRVYPSQKKPSDIGARCIVLSYDLDMRQKWAPIDDIRFNLSPYTSNPDELPRLISLLIELLHMHACVTTTGLVIYKMWHEGGPPSPMFDKEKNMWTTVLQFSASIA